MRNQAFVPLSKSLWVFVGIAVLDCALRIAALGYWWFAPDHVPNVPMLYKGMRFPEVQAGLLLAIAPALWAVVRCPLRSATRWRWIGGWLIVLGVGMFVLALFLSFNVVGAGAFYAAFGVALQQCLKAQEGRALGMDG